MSECGTIQKKCHCFAQSKLYRSNLSQVGKGVKLSFNIILTFVKYKFYNFTHIVLKKFKVTRTRKGG
jgi:heme/copper-type cytochrome/quinol oxidase subunit 3